MANIAIFYFIAQVLERILELLDWIAGFFLPEKSENKDRNKRTKMIGMWVLACFFGLVFALWLDLDLMARLDVNVSSWVDKILTSLVLGSGTKPIHDIISIMSRHRRS